MNKNRKNAFTLVELLIVIGIIALLAAILLPAINTALKKAEEAQANTEVSNIATAVKAYVSEYGKFPNHNGNSGDWNYGEGATGNAELINPLRAIAGTGNSANKNNPRKIVFLEVNTESLDADGNFIDPWDKQYCITMDTDFDNECESGGGKHGTVQGRNVIVWSVGMDETQNTADDLKSWE